MDPEMQAAYQEFMLGKSKSGVTTSQTERSPENVDQSCNYKKSSFHPTLRLLQRRLEDWKDTNQQLERVFLSLPNLSDRLYLERSCLEMSTAVTSERILCSQRQMGKKLKRLSWKDSGFRSGSMNFNSSSVLLKEDINFAMIHDILQNERMLSALRSLLASSAQIVDEIGRRLDEWMLQSLVDQDDEVPTEKISAMLLRERNALELAQDAYALLASDLYWKQKMASEVFDLCRDSSGSFVLERGDDNESPSNSFLKSAPRDGIKRISKELHSPKNRNLTWNLVNKLLLIP